MMDPPSTTRMSKPDRGDNSNDLSSIWRGRGGWSRKYLRTNLEAVRIPQVDRGNASDVPPGFGNLDVPPGFENPDVPPGFENLDVPPGFGNRDVPPSFGNPDVPPGFGKNQRLRDDGDGVLNPDVPPGSESLDVPPGFGKRNLRRCDDDVLNPDVPPGFRKQNQRRRGNGDGVLNPDVPSGFGKQNQHCRENGDGVLVPATMMGRVLEGVIEAKFDGGLVLGTECGELKGVAGGILRGAVFRRRAQTSASIGVAADVPMRRRETLTRLPSAYSYRNQNLCSKAEAWTGCNARAANLTVSPFAPETPPGFFVPVELKPVSLPDSVTTPTRGGNDRSTVNNQVMVRRVIPSDNSCLFNAVGYVMDHDKHKAPELRQVIAATVASDPTKYNEAFLGKPNADYCAWILGSENWGGVIELSILADYYRREIAAYDIQTTFCDLYGQDGNYSERVMLIYDGLHYDALAMSPSEGAPEEFDQTIFAVRADRTIGLPADLALNLVEEQQRKRPANFTWRCGVCQIGLIGQKETVEHAQATGHVNFKEYI